MCSKNICLEFKNELLYKKGTLSSKLSKRISKFGTYDDNLKGYNIAAPLIAQLGKNFTNELNKLITGDELLKIIKVFIIKYQASCLILKFLYQEYIHLISESEFHQILA